MHCVRKITEDLYYVGADDHKVHLFENIHPLENGVSYNSYLLKDEKTVLFDTVDWVACRQFIENIKFVLDGRPLDYMVINHLEPDHAACIGQIILNFPEVKIISNEKAFMIMRQFGFEIEGRDETVLDGDTRCFGKHTFAFVFAPMVHWPEAMVSYDVTTGTLFSADAFGTFGALNGKLYNDDTDFKVEGLDEARRYYTNIVGKYGPQVRCLLEKAATLDIKLVCPLHGPIFRSDIGWFVDKYMHWATYTPEEDGVLIAYGSMYGNTESAALNLAQKLRERGILNVHVHDVSTTHVSHLISKTFKLSHLVLASPTYNLGIFPPMLTFLDDLAALNVQKRTVGIIENGSWACTVGDKMRKHLEVLKDMEILDEQVTLTSKVNESSEAELERLADAIKISILEKNN